MDVKKQLTRLKHKSLAAWHSLTDKSITWGSLIRLLVLLSVVLIITAGPVLRTEGFSWKNPRDWGKAFAISWPITLATVLLRTLDVSRATKPYTDRARRRRLFSATAVDQIRNNIISQRTGDGEMQRARETLLRCIAMRVADIIQEKTEDRVVATLLDLGSDPNGGDMRVVARSIQARHAPSYKRSQLVAWEAISNGGIAVQDDVQNDVRFGGLKRAYRTVLAVPVVSENMAFAAISIDHPRPYAFAGHGHEIEEALQPFLSGILLTFPKEASTIPCLYEPAHS